MNLDAGSVLEQPGLDHIDARSVVNRGAAHVDHFLIASGDAPKPIRVQEPPWRDMRRSLVPLGEPVLRQQLVKEIHHGAPHSRHNAGAPKTASRALCARLGRYVGHRKATGGTRTLNLRFTKPLLCQLSYGGEISLTLSQ